ncbi:MAG TPA: GDSL-type esterase/lipase family protein [Chitinophagaceae bacterium]|nr:GDSL-type esterase/lipase family protein [Chitinophagaceae bacterium]
MRTLKKISLAAAAIILIALIKYGLDKISPASAPFHDNLLNGLQWLVLLGLMCWLVLQLAWQLIRKKDVPWWWTLIMLVLLVSGEWGLKGAMAQSNEVSAETRAYMLQYYLAYERELPEVQEECARYDPELTYTYKAGARSVMDGPEFSETISFNSVGLRDDEASVKAPEIICLGDSYTMGVGTPQEHTYPQVLEKLTGLKVLNAGVSSYGTARETMLLKRLDMSALRGIIIQYCFNDIAENKTYVNNKYSLPVRSSAEYKAAVRSHKWATLYYPLKRVLTISRTMVRDKLAKLLGRPVMVGPKPVEHDRSYVLEAARDFIKIIYHSGIDFSKVKVMVVDMNRYPVYDHHLAAVAEQIMTSGEYSPEFVNNIQFVDISLMNDPQFYFPLDNHLNSTGHAMLARLIYEALVAE